MLQCAAACCSVLQHSAVCCSIPQCAAACWYAAVYCKRPTMQCCSLLQHTAVCCSLPQRAAACWYAAVCCSALQCVAVYCSVLQCATVCFSVPQCAAACWYAAVCCKIPSPHLQQYNMPVGQGCYVLQCAVNDQQRPCNNAEFLWVFSSLLHTQVLKSAADFPKETCKDVYCCGFSIPMYIYIYIYICTSMTGHLPLHRGRRFGFKSVRLP